MKTVRQQRLAAQIRTILSELFLRELHDPRLHTLSITGVTIDREAQSADIYVNALGADERQAEIMSGLERAGGFLRRQLGQALRTRQTPQLYFHWDPTPAQAERINQLLDALEIPPGPTAEEEE